MESSPPPGFVWADAAFPTCLFTGEPLVIREGTLEIVGTGFEPEAMEMAYSAGADCWYARIETLFEFCADAEVEPHEAGPFRIDGRGRTAAVHISAAGVTVPWDEFVAHLVAAGPRVSVVKRPLLTDAEVLALPQTDETWELTVGEGGRVEGPRGPEPVLAGIVTDAGGLVRSVTVLRPPADARALAELVRSAAGAPASDMAPARPVAVAVADLGVAKRLGKALRKAGVAVRLGRTPLADAALEDLQAHVMGIRRLPAVFTQETDADLKAFFAAAKRFYAAKPWTRLDGNRFLAVQDADAGPDSPWTYVNVIGQMGEEHGLSVFTEWTDVCALVHDRPHVPFFLSDEFDDDPTSATLEGITLFPLAALHRDDQQRLGALGIRETAAQQVAVPMRYEDGVPGPMRLPLAWQTALLTALPDVLAKRRANQVTSIKATVGAEGMRLALRYPATGAEGLAPGLGDVRLTVVNDGARESGIESLGRGERLVVEGPAAASAYAAGKAVRQAYEAAGRWGILTAILADGRELWSGRAYATEAAPTLDDLLRAGEVVFDMGMSIYPVCVERLAAGIAPEVRAEIVLE